MAVKAPFFKSKDKINGPTAGRDQVSSFAVDTLSRAYGAVVNDTECERRGFNQTYRVGDLVKQVQGVRFYR